MEPKRARESQREPKRAKESQRERESQRARESLRDLSLSLTIDILAPKASSHLMPLSADHNDKSARRAGHSISRAWAVTNRILRICANNKNSC